MALQISFQLISMAILIEHILAGSCILQLLSESTMYVITLEVYERPRSCVYISQL